MCCPGLLSMRFPAVSHQLQRLQKLQVSTMARLLGLVPSLRASPSLQVQAVSLSPHKGVTYIKIEWIDT